MRTIEEQTIDRLLMLYMIQKVIEFSFTVYGRLKFQKLSFHVESGLMKQNLKALHFKFFSYAHGPYSKDVSLDAKFLVEREFLRGDYPYAVTEMGKNLLSSFLTSSELPKCSSQLFEQIEITLKRWAKYDGSQLRDEVYKMRITPHDLPGRKMRIRNIPVYTDILVPEAYTAKQEFVLSDDLLEDFLYEFSLTPEDRHRIAAITDVEYEERFGDL